MQDQVASLTKRGVRAIAVGGKSRKDDEQMLANIFDDNVLLIYVPPERLVSDLEKRTGISNALRSLHARGRLGFFAVDEAHCVSEWGHSFRPAFRSLRLLRAEYGEVPMLATTGTATPQVYNDIKETLSMMNPDRLVEVYSGHDRPQIWLEVAPRRDRDVVARSIIEAHRTLIGQARGPTTTHTPAVLVYARTAQGG